MVGQEALTPQTVEGDDCSRPEIWVSMDLLHPSRHICVECGSSSHDRPTTVLVNTSHNARRPRISVPNFPLSRAPSCRACGIVPTERYNVGASNPNNNAGRPYYKCKACPRWITWDDARGVASTNPLCDCNVVSRQDVAGERSSSPGLGFWTCATGRCGYYATRRDGLTPLDLAMDPGEFTLEDASRFRPWLYSTSPSSDKRQIEMAYPAAVEYEELVWSS